MAIKAEDLQEIDAILANADASVYGALRQKYPHLAWSRCDAEDVTEEPFRSYPAFHLHLFDVSNHCPVVVNDPAEASGFILATRSPGK